MQDGLKAGKTDQSDWSQLRRPWCTTTRRALRTHDRDWTQTSSATRLRYAFDSTATHPDIVRDSGGIMAGTSDDDNGTEQICR